MSIFELLNYFEIQGGFHIKKWSYADNDYITIAKGNDFESDKYNITEKMLDKKITYMYAVDGVLNIEVE